MDHNPRIIIIAGPNGAGKTTFATKFLVKEIDCPYFINADIIAGGLAPFSPERAAFKAGRLMIKEIREYFDRRESFSFETTLSGYRYSRLIPLWQQSGYFIKLIFLSLPYVELALERVKLRVSQGGHHVKEDIVRRRFYRSRENFDTVYKKLVDVWVEYDNSGETPCFIDSGENL